MDSISEMIIYYIFITKFSTEGLGLKILRGILWDPIS